jgi:hypothetical protein
VMASSNSTSSAESASKITSLLENEEYIRVSVEVFKTQIDYLDRRM